MLNAEKAKEKAKKIRIARHIKYIKKGINTLCKKGNTCANLEDHCFVIYTFLDEETKDYFINSGYKFIKFESDQYRGDDYIVW